MYYRSYRTDRTARHFSVRPQRGRGSSLPLCTPLILWNIAVKWFNSRFISVWISSPLRRYPVQRPELGCYGHAEFSPGVRNYGIRDPSELFDVYCFINNMRGEIPENTFTRTNGINLIFQTISHYYMNEWDQSNISNHIPLLHGRMGSI